MNDTVTKMIDDKIIELENQQSKFQKLYEESLMMVNSFKNKSEKAQEDILKLNNNLDYIKNTAKIVTLSRYTRIKQQLKEKKYELMSATDELNKANKVVDAIDRNLQRTKISGRSLNEEEKPCCHNY